MMELSDTIVTNKQFDQFSREFFKLLDDTYAEEGSRDFDVEGFKFRVISVPKTIEPRREILSY